MSVLRATNSASNLARRQSCPGSAHAEKDLPRVESPYSEEGTALHRADAYPYEPRDRFTAQQREILDRNEALRQAFLDRELPRLGISPEAKCIKFVEREFVLCDFDGEPVSSHGQPVPGHPDLILWYPEFLVAIIFDSKFGRNEVTAAWLNLQLKSYFVMFCDNFQPETVIVAITQPWVKSPNDFHSAEYSGQDLDRHRQELLDIIRATEPANAPRHASVEACTYCAAVAQCPIAITAATEMAVIKVNDLTPEQLEQIGPEIDLAALVIEHWHKRMIHLATTFPNLLKLYELKSTGATRQIKDTAEAVRCVANSGLFGDSVDTSFHDPAIDEILKLCEFSIAMLEEHIATSQKATKKIARERAEKILGALITTVEKKKSLAKKTASLHATD